MRKICRLIPIIWAILALTATSLWPQTPGSSSSTSWWRITQDKVPYPLFLFIAVLAFVLGSLLRPLLADAGNMLLRWMQGWGKKGRFRQKYLNDLVSRYRHLSLLPANVVAARWEYRRKFVELEELYVPLSLDPSDGVRHPGFSESPWSSAGRRRWWHGRPGVLRRFVRRPERPTSADVANTIRSHPRLVVSGHPGSGKTTLLCYLAISCARSLRNDKRDGDDPHIVRKRLGWKKSPFPVFVPLNLLADRASLPEGKRLLDGIVETLPEELRCRYPKGFFDKQLEKGNCLVLFDGFDELGDRTARGKMACLIEDLANTYNHPDNRFIVSTRVVGYEGQLDRYGFALRTVLDLDEGAVRELVTRRYQAIAVGESLGRSEQEAADLSAGYSDRAQHLLADLEQNKGLRTLTTNPLLLSLIVLVHLVRVKLPEQRHILYRDCVEILTERWQVVKRAAAGLPAAARPDDLTLAQKTEVLRDIALAMQERRREGEGHALIRREEVEATIAARLPHFISAHLPGDGDPRAQECARRAGLLLDNILEDSGILVEKGLDTVGKPVVGFSHLTFQEYLVADALRERCEKSRNLLDHLFDPAWREVLLLYVSMAQAGDVLQKCLDDSTQPLLVRYLLAGRCLAEGARVDEQRQRGIISGLSAYLCPPADTCVKDIRDLFIRVGGVETYDWLIGNIAKLLTEDEREKLDVSPDLAGDGKHYRQMQKASRRLMKHAGEIEARYNMGCVLSSIGDPRKLDEMIDIPAGEFTMGSDCEAAVSDERPVHRVRLDAYIIGKYPVTNAQYERFVIAEGHEPPGHWQEGKLPPWMANQPVVNVSWLDAQAYCKWLSDASGRQFRLPTEAEWEKAARGEHAREWPWGNEFDSKKANTYEGGPGRTSAVGSYSPEGDSPYGAADMAGNVWEWCSTLSRGYPYRPDDGREDLEAEGSRLLRGGSWYNDSSFARCAVRNWNLPVNRLDLVGFRVAAFPSSR